MYVGTGGGGDVPPPAGCSGCWATGRDLSVDSSCPVRLQLPLTIDAAVMTPFLFQAPKVPADWPRTGVPQGDEGPPSM